MGEVIEISGYRARRRRDASRRAAPVCFYFDLSCPFSYMAAERVEAAFSQVRWRPASASLLAPLVEVSETQRDLARAAATRRAAALRLPLVWPERWPAQVPGAMRAAAYAATVGRETAFVLAAGRLAFGGGFDLDHPEAIAEAAAAASVDVDACLTAAGDPKHDPAIAASARQLLGAGARRTPVLDVGGVLFCGEARVAEAASAARHRLVGSGAV